MLNAIGADSCESNNRPCPIPLCRAGAVTGQGRPRTQIWKTALRREGMKVTQHRGCVGGGDRQVHPNPVVYVCCAGRLELLPRLNELPMNLRHGSDRESSAVERTTCIQYSRIQGRSVGNRCEPD